MTHEEALKRRVAERKAQRLAGLVRRKVWYKPRRSKHPKV